MRFKYRILTANSAEELQDQVIEYMLAGWMPAGGVAVQCVPAAVLRELFIPTEWTWAQAMTRDENS